VSFCKGFWEVNTAKLKYKLKNVRDIVGGVKNVGSVPCPLIKDAPDTLIGVGGCDKGIIPSLY